jgi:hypothetical protein
MFYFPCSVFLSFFGHSAYHEIHQTFPRASLTVPRFS